MIDDELTADLLNLGKRNIDLLNQIFYFLDVIDVSPRCLFARNSRVDDEFENASPRRVRWALELANNDRHICLLIPGIMDGKTQDLVGFGVTFLIQDWSREWGCWNEPLSSGFIRVGITDLTSPSDAIVLIAVAEFAGATFRCFILAMSVLF